MEVEKTIYCIGLMSGTSCDGLDIAYCSFSLYKDSPPKYTVICAEIVDYSADTIKKLRSAETIGTFEFLMIDREYGTLIGTEVSNFMKRHDIKKVDFIASHGHTIFHQPHKGITVQIGNPHTIAAAANVSVVADFRSMDVALGGQGAPLVPIGDKLLFKEYDFCLNLGGIANISYDKKMAKTSTIARIAFDNSPMNMALNYFAQKKGMEFDEGGSLARKGKVNTELFAKLKALDYFKREAPKSLGKEWIFENFVPVLEQSKLSVEDVLATTVEVACTEIARAVITQCKEEPGTKRKMLVTGGGAFNDYAIERLRLLLNDCCEVIVPDKLTVKFKEAIVFGFLGALRWTNQVNCLSSVTGAKRDNIGGIIVQV